jgi:lambda family phage portal protein
MLTVFRGRVGRALQAFRTPPAVPAIRNQYDSATTGRRARGWSASTLGPNASTLPNLGTLRARSRQAYRDDAYGGGALDYRVEQLIGTGITPKSLARDEKVRVQVQALWDRWTKESDADGLLNFYGQQVQATRCWQTAGEVFTRLRLRLPSDGLSVPLQLQILEPELCPIEHTMTGRGGTTIRAGIEFSPILRRTAYWFYRAHPADGELDASRLVSVPAERVLHLYLPERAGQLRGVPHLFRALLTMRGLDVGEDAALVRWQLGNMFMAALEHGPVSDATLDPITGQAIERDAKDQPVIAMEAGGIADLGPGEKLTWNDPPEAGQTYEAFVRQQGRKIAAAARVPYHALTGDMAQVNDRTIRVILQDFRRSLEQLQWTIFIHQFCEPVWRAWFDRAVLAGALTVPAAYWDDPMPWRDVEWAPDRFPYIHPVQDVEADKLEIRAGLASRMHKVKARGYDIEAIDQARAEDNAREARLGLVSDSNAAKTAGTGAAQPAMASREGTPEPMME